MDADTQQGRADVTRVRRKTALVAAAMLVPLDVFLDLLCTRFPLIFYLVFAGIGYALGGRVYAWLSRPGFWSKSLRVMGILIGLTGVVGGGFLNVYHQPTHSKCFWRYCSRLIGPGVLNSPFLPPPVSCHALSICVNEYPYSRSEGKKLYSLISENGCPAP